MDPKQVNLSEVLFEYVLVGRYLRVNAIDPRTGIEVSMIADPRQGKTIIKRLAARKLAYVISKKRPSLAGSQKFKANGRGHHKDETA